MLDLNSGPLEVKVCLSTMPHASSLGPGWEQSRGDQDPGPQQVCGRTARLPCEAATTTGSTFPVWGSSVPAAHHHARPLLGSDTATVAAKCRVLENPAGNASYTMV